MQAAKREINGGMRILKATGDEFDHVGKVRDAMNGLNKQAAHLEKVLQRTGLSESQVRTINGLIEQARDLLGIAQQAITKDPM